VYFNAASEQLQGVTDVIATEALALLAKEKVFADRLK